MSGDGVVCTSTEGAFEEETELVGGKDRAELALLLFPLQCLLGHLWEAGTGRFAAEPLPERLLLASSQDSARTMACLFQALIPRSPDWAGQRRHCARPGSNQAGFFTTACKHNPWHCVQFHPNHSGLSKAWIREARRGQAASRHTEALVSGARRTHGANCAMLPAGRGGGALRVGVPS